MKNNITRRKALISSTVISGFLMPVSCQSFGEEEVLQDGHQPFLSPWSPPVGQERNLTPGTTPLRIAARGPGTDLQYPDEGSITEIVREIKDSGYSSTTARYGVGNRNPWLNAPEADIRELKVALQQYDVTFFGFRAANNLIHPDSEERKVIHRWLIEQCEASERLGAPTVTTAIGSKSPESATTIHPDNWTNETWREGIKVIKEILTATAGMKVVLGIEALNLTAVNNPRAHAQLIEEVSDPRCKVTLDPVNMIHTGNYYKSTELIEECFELLGENIVVADAKDSYILPRRMSCYLTEVAPGLGVVDYETYLVGLSRLAYPRPLLIEGISAEDCPKAKQYLEDTAAKVGVKIYG